MELNKKGIFGLAEWEKFSEQTWKEKSCLGLQAQGRCTLDESGMITVVFSGFNQE